MSASRLRNVLLLILAADVCFRVAMTSMKCADYVHSPPAAYNKSNSNENDNNNNNAATAENEEKDNNSITATKGESLDGITTTTSSGSSILPQAFRNNLLLLVDTDKSPCWSIASLRNRLLKDRTPVLFVVHNKKVMEDCFTTTANDVIAVQSLWVEVHQKLQLLSNRLDGQVDWIVQMSVDHAIDVDRMRQYLSREYPNPNRHQLLWSSSGAPAQNTWSTGMVFSWQTSRLIASGVGLEAMEMVDSPEIISNQAHSCHAMANDAFMLRACHKWLLLPVNNKPAVQQQQQQQSQHTIVTAYFPLNAKHPPSDYEQWMVTMLSVQDPVIVFTSEVALVQQHREHALDRTLIVPMQLTDLPLAQRHNATFWQRQMDINPDREQHKDYRVLWIWLSKTFWIMESIRLNPFGSDMFMWCDIGSFRFDWDKERLFGKELIRHPELVPRHSILQISHNDIRPHPSVWLARKIPYHFFHSGSQAVGYSDTWERFYEAFQTTVQHFLERNLFIGEDQIVMQATCVQNNDLCTYLNRKEVNDDEFFGLKYMLHFGGDHQFLTLPNLERWNETDDKEIKVQVFKG